VKDEAARLPEFLASLERQTRVPDVIVITDGGSRDATPKVLAEFASKTSLPFRWLAAPGNRSVGRNAAIRAELIAATDVSVLDQAWFERIIAPIERGDADVVAGWYELLVDTSRERAVGLMTQWSLDQVDSARFLPSSRSVAFTRAAWERVGGYPADLVTTEDTAFDLSLRAAGLRFVFEARAVVRWRPATDARGAYRMYREFAESDARARLFLRSPSRYGLIMATYAGGALLLLLGVLWPLLWIAFALLATAYLGIRIRKVLRAHLWSQVPYAVVVAASLDVAMIVGYARGVATRSRVVRTGTGH